MSIIKESLTNNDRFRGIISTERGTKATIEVASAAGEINLRKGVRRGFQQGSQVGEEVGKVLQTGGAVLGPAGLPLVGVGFGVELLFNSVGVLSGGKTGDDFAIDLGQSAASVGTGKLLNRVAIGPLEQTITSNVINHQFLLINFGIDTIQEKK